MGLLDTLTSPLRSVLGIAGDEVIEHSPLRETEDLERKLDDAVTAIHRAADSMEQHVAVVETLAASVPALTESVNSLVAELNSLLKVIAPVAAVEKEAERVEGFFHRRRHEEPERSGGDVPPR
jgi:hypothetical protein